ncbi:MAG: hypothetical protein IJN93_02255 [Clostridia bacterium]|nr:hypothetical protein [Clostridia bacterium]
MKNKKFSIAVDDKVYYKARSAAKAENRSVAGLIRYLLNRYLENYEREKGSIKF